ncbi:Hypothetical predicted protein [Podarcis lilfordi]|uniref:Uncharacterized protein n=1 Tax=Podarcis lilfordi TaxID=74358 RepID=A0AA35KWU7_9SAUR|nr:Hypothetical predicted protein [Podarcis lilfordi]
METVIQKSPGGATTTKNLLFYCVPILLNQLAVRDKLSLHCRETKYFSSSHPHGKDSKLYLRSTGSRPVKTLIALLRFIFIQDLQLHSGRTSQEINDRKEGSKMQS